MHGNNFTDVTLTKQLIVANSVAGNL